MIHRVQLNRFWATLLHAISNAHTLTHDCNILVSSAGRRVVLIRLFQQALRELGLRGQVLATDLTSNASGYQAADNAFLTPRFDDPDYVPQLITLCKAHKVKLLIPTIDTELDLYAAHLEAFAEAGTTIAISAQETIHIGCEKKHTHQWLTENGFPTPRQATLDQALANPEDWTTPLLVKPAIGSSSVGVTRVKRLEDIKKSTKHGEMIVQTIAHGDEYTVDVYVDRAGKPRCSVPRLRMETRGGEVSKGMAVRNREIQDLAEAICAKLPGAYGVFNVQMFVHPETGEKQVIEFNPRFGGGYPLSHQAGAHFTHWLVEDAMGLPSSIVAEQWHDGMVMLRYDDAIFVDRSQIER